LSVGVVKNFVAAYEREFDFYQAAARLCSQRCESLLAGRGVRAIVTHRAKRSAKLLTKLLQRDVKHDYQDSQQIRDDIADLAGVRIALYFPGDRIRVARLIQDNFAVIQTKNFPEPGKKREGKRFEGYYADHYRVSILDTSLDETQKAYAAARIEIQVGSVLMHAWAEVEHDLVYKPESGRLSEEEHAILDELNGMVLTGEIALERLQRAVERRLTEADVQFDNQYELAAFLYKWIRHFSLNSEPPMGRVDILLELLRKADLNDAAKLRDVLASLGPSVDGQTVSDQIVDAVLEKLPELYQTYVSLQTELALPVAYDQSSSSIRARTVAIGSFLSSWIVLERTFSIIAGKMSSPGIASRIIAINFLSSVAQKLKLSREAVNTLSRARTVRNQLVHGIEIPNAAYLDEATSELQTVLAEISSHPDPAVRAAYEEASRPLQH